MIVFAVFVVLTFLIGLGSRRLEKTIITAPMIFTTAGIALAFALPGLAQVEIKDKMVMVISEVTLVLLLFTDGSRINFGDVMAISGLPVRLLAIGMPLTILAGSVAAALVFPGLKIWEAAILATILAPTDAGLGQVVVSSSRVPLRIREALDVEAGLNDGLSVPFLMLFIALARAEQPLDHQSWVIFAIQLVGLGILSGVFFGWVGGWLIEQARQHGWMAEASEQLALLALAVMAWLAAGAIGGNGFIAAFVAGLTVKTVFESAGDHMIRFSEAWGELLNSFVFLMFGTIAGSMLGQFGQSVIGYAILSLTIVRMVPVTVALLGTRLEPATIAFLGWFGPRGLASIVLGLVFLEEETELSGEPVIVLAIIATVLLSIFAHGISAAPAIRRYARGQPEEAAM